jgi:hypothetical protein
MNFLPNPEDFRCIFLSGGAKNLEQEEGEHFLPKIGETLRHFLPKSEKILVVLSPEIRESCHQKAEGRIPPISLPPLAPALSNNVRYSANDS